MCRLSTCHIPWFKLTAVDISQLDCRTKTEKKQVISCRLHVLSKALVPFVVFGDFQNSDCLLLGTCLEAVILSQRYTNTTASAWRRSVIPSIINNRIYIYLPKLFSSVAENGQIDLKITFAVVQPVADVLLQNICMCAKVRSYVTAATNVCLLYYYQNQKWVFIYYTTVVGHVCGQV